MRRLVPRGIRSRLLLSVVFAVAAAIAALTLGFNLLLSRSLDGNADDLLRARAAAVLATLRTADGELVVPEAPDDAALDALVWVFADGRVVESPRAPAASDDAATELARAPGAFRDVPSSATRLYATPVVRDGERLGAVVVGVSLAPYEHAERLALYASLAFAGVLCLVVFVAARWLLSGALRPVARMTADAEAWSEHDLDRRFELGEPYDELTTLGRTLDHLLDRLAASLRREQRFSAELSHELRTPLARIATEAELALRHDRRADEYQAALAAIRQNAQDLTRTLDALVAAARYESRLARGTADGQSVAEQAVKRSAGLARECGVELVARSGSPVRIGVDADLAARILQPVVDNACRYAASTVTIDVARNGSSVVYRIVDDGPGIEPDEAERIFEPGVRGRSGTAPASHPGAGLGLALARRLARAASGEVEVGHGADAAGAVVIVRLPAG